jgi:nicotinate dehydrogenase subunit B
MTDLPSNLKANPLLSRWVSAGADDVLVIRSGKVELGQGISTAMAAIAAAELAVPFERIRVEATETEIAPEEGWTAGSFSVEHGGSAMRWACAMVRELFAEAAAQALGTTPDDIVVADGLFRRTGANEGLAYHRLRDRVNLDVQATDRPAPRIFGGSADRPDLYRIDLRAKLSGPAFIQDMALPHMAYGRILRPTHPKDRLIWIDRAAVETRPGVVAVVVDGGFCGVVAERDDLAVKAVEFARKSARWERSAELPAMGEANAWMDACEAKSATFIADEGEAAPAAFSHSARYSRPYIAHASVGPSCGVAEFDGTKMHVWSHSQGIYPLRKQIARVVGLPLEDVTVTHAPGSGCYGHNAADDAALDAALLAKALGRPVMVQWTRADELSWSPFGSPGRAAVSASVGADGMITEWTYDVWSPPHLARPGFGDGINLLAAWHLAEPHAPSPPNDAPRPQGGGDRNAVPLYKVGRRRLTHHVLPERPLHTSAMRALGAHCNVFAIESFLDELAVQAGVDPVEFRIRHLDDPRAIGVIRAAAEAAGWDPADAGGDGVGRGIGFARYKNSGAYYACIAKVEVAESVRLTSVVGAVDAGFVVHRDGLLNQVEGGAIQAASWTLKEQVRWNEDGFAVRSWADYPLLKFSEMPEIRTVVVEDPSAASLGSGECAAGPVAAAIGNAVAHALGVRVRDMPLTPERITAAINAA